LNNKQKDVLWISIFIVCAMGIYPPWTYTLDIEGLHYEKSGDHSWLLNPPAAFNESFTVPSIFLARQYHPFFSQELYEEFKKLDFPKIEATGVHIDFPRLTIQWLIVAFITLGFIVTFQKKK